MKNFKGIFPALLTPFTAEGKIDEKALERVIEMNLRKGVAGFYVNGSTAEVFLLSDEERRTVYRLVKEIVGDRATLIAHIGAISTLHAVEFGRYAESLGYDAVSSIAPFYYKFSFNEIKGHYFTIADEVDLPMLVYNFPGFSGVTLTPEQIGEFLQDDRFIGVKHTSNDFFALERFKTLYPNKIIYNGFDEMFLSGIAMGADGGVGSTYNFMAEKFVKIIALVKSGEMEAARAVQAEVNAILAALYKVGIMQGEKAILTLMGYEFGVARPPFGALSKEDIALLEREALPLCEA